MMVRRWFSIYSNTPLSIIGFILLLLLSISSPIPCFSAYPFFGFSAEILKKTENEYGKEGVGRLQEWRKFITENINKTEWEKVESVNRFINTFTSVEDSEQWHKEDYWATPHQFIASGGGDCEDFCIAKYFTLKTMGIAAVKIRIAYIKVSGKDEPHMVLFYFPEADQSPLILDNLERKILPLESRPDMKLIYSADEANVWVNKNGDLFCWAGKSSMLHKWRDVIQKIAGKTPEIQTVLSE